MATQTVTEKNFTEITTKSGIVLLDFWAPWCAPCRAFGPVFEKTAEKHPDIVFGKINTEEEQALAAGLGIRSIPTLMIFRDGVMLFSQPGMLPANVLEDLIGKAADLDMELVRREIEREKGEKASAAAAPAH